MMKKYFLLILFFTGFTRIAGQDLSRVRYRDMIFKSVSITANQSYRSAGMPKAKSRDYLIDIYQPKNDTRTGRPLIIWIHGGGFKFGHKRTRGTPIWSKTFARRGYVCIAMNYRRSKGNPLGNFREMLGSCYNAMDDLNHLVAWSKKNAKKLGIDTSRIILAGNSAGGMIALQSAYSSLNNMAILAKRSDSLTASKTVNQNNAVAVINFWGAVFDSTWLKNADVPIVSAHGTLDRVVPFDHLIVPVYGSAVVHRQAGVFKIPNSLKAYQGYTHELQRPFHPIFYSKKAKNRWLEAGQFAADFLFDKVIKN
jgi:poly(3-hydroxybutyrate) depolymerase